MLKYIVFLLFLITFPAMAQHQVGIQYSNYAFPATHQTNPAALGSSKLKLGINFVNAEASIFNNYVKWNAPFSFITFFTGQVPNKYKNTDGLVIWKESYTDIKKKDVQIDGSINFMITGPSIFYRFEKLKLGMQVGLNIKSYNALSKTSEQIGNLIVKSGASPYYNKLVLDNQASLNLGYFKEWYVSFGRTVFDFGEKKLKMGISAKYLTGDSFLSIDAQKLDYTVFQDPSNFVKSNTRFDRTVGDIFVSGNADGLNAPSFLRDLFYTKGSYGYSGSLGFIFEFRPEYRKYSKKHDVEWIELEDKISYKFKIGLSFDDFGKLIYKSARALRVSSTSPVFFKNGEIQDNATPNSFYNLVSDKFTNEINLDQSTLSFFTPSRIHGFVDYHLKEHQFITVFFNQPIDLNTTIGFKGVSSYGIIPRYETKNIEFSLPIMGLNSFQHFTIGLAGRYRGFYLGTNHILGFFNFSKTKGASIFGGLFLPIYYQPQRLGNKCYYPSKKPIGNKKNLFSKIKRGFKK